MPECPLGRHMNTQNTAYAADGAFVTSSGVVRCRRIVNELRNETEWSRVVSDRTGIFVIPSMFVKSHPGAGIAAAMMTCLVFFSCSTGNTARLSQFVVFFAQLSARFNPSFEHVQAIHPWM